MLNVMSHTDPAVMKYEKLQANCSYTQRTSAFTPRSCFMQTCFLTEAATTTVRTTPLREKDGKVLGPARR